ncbi:MAG: glutamyl-tRNA reductase [Planctomycetes bacterium B3_Pla]|nr:MAG: glutamyl-tRNA reductase [Planctomycetes bacterium B3_Pla]
MKIVVLGLNHKTAPVEIREKLAFDTAETSRALCELKKRFAQAEFALISTCNRVELYCAGKHCQGADPDRLAGFLSEFHGIELDKFREFLYIHEDEDAVRHLLTVASSLDSLVVGEAQIIGQVKDSYKLACAAKTTGKVLNRLFHSAFATSKKVYTTTSISSGRVSVAGVAVELAKQLFADISSAKVVVIGAGDMGQLIIQHLLQVGARNITVVNRSYDRGLKVAEQYGIDARQWEHLDEQLIGANIAIASASVQDYLFRKDSFKKIMARRREETLLIIDIAVPRNFEPAVNELEGLYLYSVDDLAAVVEQNRKARQRDMARGMEIVLENVTEFTEWFGAKDIGPLIGRMKEQFAQIGRNEMDRFFVGTREEASCKEVMEEMVNRVVNKLLHCVIKNVNIVAKEDGATEAARLVDTIVKQAEEITSEPNGDKEDSQS